MNSQEDDDKKLSPTAGQEATDEMDQTDRGQVEIVEGLVKDGSRKCPPNFIPVGAAKPIIDRDEVWVH